jgi:hypothetical protein
MNRSGPRHSTCLSLGCLVTRPLPDHRQLVIALVTQPCAPKSVIYQARCICALARAHPPQLTCCSQRSHRTNKASKLLSTLSIPCLSRVQALCCYRKGLPANAAGQRQVRYMVEIRIQVPRHAVPLCGPSGSPAVRWCLKKLLIPPLLRWGPAAPVLGWYLMPAQYSLRYRLVLLKAVSTMRYLDSRVTRTAVMLAPGTDALTAASPRDVLSTEHGQQAFTPSLVLLSGTAFSGGDHRKSNYSKANLPTPMFWHKVLNQ